MRHQTIAEVIEDVVRRCKGKSREEVADEVGTTYSSFSRMLNPNDDGARFPAELLIPVMKATRNYEPLRHIAARTGHIVINVNKLKVPKGSGADIPNDLQLTFADLTKMLIEFFRKPDIEKKKETMAALDIHLGEAIAARKKVEKWEQPELEFEG